MRLAWVAVNDEIRLRAGVVAGDVAILFGDFRAPAFGRALGRMSVGFGLFGAVAAVVLLVEPGHAIAVGVVFTLIVFNLVLGWRNYTNYTLSRIPVLPSPAIA